MISRQAADFIIDGDGDFSDDSMRISINHDAEFRSVNISMSTECITGILIDAFLDEFGDLAMIFPNYDIRVPIMEASA